ncbi:hypothetical protein D3C72_2354100 [compost metagenome]
MALVVAVKVTSAPKALDADELTSDVVVDALSTVSPPGSVLLAAVKLPLIA